MEITWVYFIIEFSPLVHPDLGQAGVIVIYDATSSSGEGVGRSFAENMPDMGACDY